MSNLTLEQIHKLMNIQCPHCSNKHVILMAGLKHSLFMELSASTETYYMCNICAGEIDLCEIKGILSPKEEN